MKNSRCSEAGGDALLHVAVELGAGRIGRVARIGQAGKRHDPSDHVVDCLVALQRGGELRAAIGRRRQCGELALVGLLEGHAVGFGAAKIAPDRGIVDRRIEIGQVPLGQSLPRREPFVGFFGVRVGLAAALVLVAVGMRLPR